MKSNMRAILALGVLLPLIGFGFLNLQTVWAATNISSTYKYAWSENVGWQNWRSTNAQATVGTTYLVGYVWAENIGWIKLGSTPESGTYPNTTKDNWGVNRNDSTGELSGYAWSENVGWINFSPTNGGVTIDPGTGKFDGYAWGENVGWIHFQNASPEYYVQQEGPLVVNLIFFTAMGWEDYVRLEWETASEIDTAGFHLWRGERADGFYARITDSLIPAEGGAAWGATYAFEDWDVALGKTYFYQLEDIDSAGVRTFHGPVSAWAGVTNIQAGNNDNLAMSTEGHPVSVKVAVQAGNYAGTPVEYWVAALTPFGWYAYGPEGWSPSIETAAVAPLGDVKLLEVFNAPLPVGWYTFYLVVDDQINGSPDLTWLDSVDVRVE